jgi:hypothetical protein
MRASEAAARPREGGYDPLAMRAPAPPLVIAVFLAGCGAKAVAPPTEQPDAGSTTVTGTVSGVSIPSAHALAVPDDSQTTAEPQNQYARLTIEIASQPLTCTSGPLPNAAFIGILLAQSGPNPIGPGAYTITNDSLGDIENLASLVSTDATCAETTPATCIAGTVTIAAVSPTIIRGSFALSFDTGEAMQGTFAADICATAPPALTGAACD